MNNTLPLFQQYTSYDTKIVKTATRYGLYLIGGTAIDLLCRYYSVPFWRSRSDNDLDFWAAYDNSHKDKFVRHIRRTLEFVVKEDSDYMLFLESPTIHADILIDYDHNNCKFGYTVNDIKVMSPIYLFASKFDRYVNCNNARRKTTDFKDLQTLLLLMFLHLQDDFLSNNETADGLFGCKHFVALSKANACLFLYKRKHSTADEIQNLNRLSCTIKTRHLSDEAENIHTPSASSWSFL